LGSKMRRELVYFGLIAGFGLVVLPFLVYLAGVLSLGPYEGGLLARFSRARGRSCWDRTCCSGRCAC